MYEMKSGGRGAGEGKRARGVIVKCNKRDFRCDESMR
jgi:hypothetical protein